MFANCNKLTGTITLGSIESYTDMFRGASIEEPYKVSVYYRDNTYDDVVAEVAQKNSEDRVEIVGTEYRIEYILNNGTLTTENSKSVKSDSPDFILNNPTRTGYTFTGWTGSNGTTPELTVTIHPAAMQDRTYTANWTPNNDTTYYVMHWKQKLNGIASAKDSINYELAETESLVGETGATITPDVKSYDGFTAPDVTSDIIMASGSTIVNYYYTRNYYTITFNESNGIESSSGSGRYLYEENVTLSAKVKDNYQITGWSASSGTTITSTGNDSGVTLTMPAKNITVTISSSPIEYKITYDLDGGTSLNPTKYNIESDDITLTAPTKEGYEFLGWSGTDLAEPSLEVTIPKGSNGDREYQATWKNLGYHIVYNLDGGTLENKVSYYKITSDDIEVGAPTKTGYTFNGWKNEKTGEITEKILIPTGSTGDREYTALWLINTYQQILNVRYENVDGTFTDYEEIANEVKDYGSTFEWKRDADSEFETGYMSYTVEESRTEDITIYRKKYNLTIDAALDGNYFTNLDSMGTVSVFVNGETVLDDKNGGAISVRSGSTYEVYNIKTNDGYTYNGITKGTQLGIVSANTTVRLSYSIIPYTISYDLNGGSGATGNPKGYTVKSEDIKLEEPTRENYDFIGWSLSSDPAVKETIIKKGSTGDRKYVAKWTAKEFKITYNLDGGTLHGEQNTFTMDSPTFELNTPSKAGYTFLGWTGSNGDTPERLVMIENGSVGDKTYTANWERNANTGYTVNYWRQKLTGDATVKDDKNYTLYESQHFEGETDTEVYAPLKDFDGFETPDDKIVKIKGDGSSVVDYYFVRESFIVTVDTAGNGNIEITMVMDTIKYPKSEQAVAFLTQNLLNAKYEISNVFNGLEYESYDDSNADSACFPNVYVVTSVKPGTGKSFLSVNLACAIAKYGKIPQTGARPKVALVEADMQTLSIGTLLSIDEDGGSLKAAMEAVSTIFQNNVLTDDMEKRKRVNRIIRRSMNTYKELANLDVLVGSSITPEEIDHLAIIPEYFTYILDELRKDYDYVVVDTNSSIFHVSSFPILQRAKECFYVLNLDFNNVRNNLRYKNVLKELGISDKVKYILNENIENTKEFWEQGVEDEELNFTAEDIENKYFTLVAKVPILPKTVFLNRLYEGTPVVLDSNKKEVTNKAKLEIMKIANSICPKLN